MRYTGGVTGYLEVLTNETNAFSAELALVQARQNELLAPVQFYEALGGGWQQWGDHAARSSVRGYRLKRVGDSSTSNIQIAGDHSGEDAIVRLKGRIDV